MRVEVYIVLCFFFSSRRRHTRCSRDWSSDVCSSDLNATDGQATIDDMAHAARALGYQYIAITDHSKRVTMAHGLDAKRLREQCRGIDERNGANPGGRGGGLPSGTASSPTTSRRASSTCP